MLEEAQVMITPGITMVPIHMVSMDMAQMQNFFS